MTNAGRRILSLLFALPWCVAGADGADGDEKPVAVYDVFQLRGEDGGLVLRTARPPTPEGEFETLALAGIGGTATVANSGAGGGGGGHEPGPAVVPNFFKLEVSNDERPDQRVGIVVSWRDGVLEVVKHVYYTGENQYTRVTRLLASANPEGGGGPAVQVIVTETGDVGREPLKVHLREADLLTLGREHPAAVDEHLRPLLHELGQEAAFAPEPQVAWQVFADCWEPAEPLRRAVAELLPRLDADDAADREAASDRVADLGQEAMLVLMRLDRTTLSAEQNSRIDSLIDDFAPLTGGEAERLRSDVPFLLDCLNSDDPRTRAAALDQLREVASKPVEFDTGLEVRARGVAVAALRAKLAPPPPWAQGPDDAVAAPDQDRSDDAPPAR